MRTLSLAHFTVMDADPVMLIDSGAAGGFDMVGLRIVAPLPTDRIVPVIGDKPLQRRIKERMRATGVRILDVEAIWLMGETDIAMLEPALDLGAELGAAYVLTVGFDPERPRLAENLGRFCEAAGQRGLRVMLEFIPYSHVRTLAEAHDLLAEIAPRNAGILVDALHLSRSGGHPADLAAYDPALFSYMHLCDAPSVPPPAEGLRAEARGRRLYPGEGALWLDDFVAAFPPGVPVAIEAPSERHADVPPLQRAALAGDACRRLLGKGGQPVRPPNALTQASPAPSSWPRSRVSRGGTVLGLSGRGFLALWNGVEESRAPEYNLWHTREHVPERIDIPGMIGARRYVDGRGTLPVYFTLYDLDSTEVLTSAPYRTRLETPTAWSRSMRPSFRGFLRYGCITVASVGGGIGGAAATAMLSGVSSVDPTSVAVALREVLQLRGVTAAHFGSIDTSIPGVPFTIGGDSASAPEPDAVLVVESFDSDALATSLPAVHACLAGAGLAMDVPDWTIYRLGYVVTRAELSDLVLMSQ